MTSPKLERVRRDAEFIEWEAWRGSFYSDDDEIIRRNMHRAYMDPKGFIKTFLGFRLARDEEREA